MSTEGDSEVTAGLKKKPFSHDVDFGINRSSTFVAIVTLSFLEPNSVSGWNVERVPKGSVMLRGIDKKEESRCDGGKTNDSSFVSPELRLTDPRTL